MLMEHLLRTIQPFLLGSVFLLIYLAEHIYPQRKQHALSRHDFRNFGIGIFNAALTFAGGYGFQLVITSLSRHHVGLFNLIELPVYISLPVQILLLDIFMYWWHRINHIIPFLWQFHHFHHIDEEMNSTTALRFHAVELSLSYVARLLVFPFFGFSLTAILLYGLLFLPVVILHHSNISIRESFDLRLRKLIVTPHMHRIHHSAKYVETNSNYSSVFPWWDRLFRSYRKYPSGIIRFGVDETPRKPA